MKIDVKIPEVGESVQEALLVEWYSKDGDRVHKDQILFLIETDKVTLEVVAEADGILHILVAAGETVAVGAVVATIETEVGREEQPKAPKAEEPARPAVQPKAKEETPEQAEAGEDKEIGARREEEPAEAPMRKGEEPSMSPSARALMERKGIDPSRVTGSGPGGRITRGDVLLYLEEHEGAEKVDRVFGEPVSAVKREAVSEGEAPERKREAGLSGAEKKEEPPEKAPVQGEGQRPSPAVSENVVRKPMSPIRRRIAEHLLHARQSTAMLTTFNEVDMSRVQEIRRNFRDAFKARHGVTLGLMSFFIKASVAALKEIPEVNAFIDGKDILYHDYYHIGVAVGGERGLVVPVIRHADRLSFAAIEQAIGDFVHKIQENKLEISHMEGGTFTISNGGVYGSLLSTPILNTPQSAILGLHKIEERPVVVEGQIVIRPMMYVALSYDHRIIDGREAVTFLKRIKECIENPERIMVEV